MKESLVMLVLALGVSVAHADVLPPDLKPYVDKGVLGGTWQCSVNATVEVGPNFRAADKTTMRTILNMVKDQCRDKVEMITFQSKSPFKNIARWSMDGGEELKELQ